MSAFIDPEARDTVVLSRCYCPGEPHENDTVVVRAQYGYGDVLELARVHTGRLDPMAERAKLLELGIVEWSFVGKDGQPAPIGLPMILLLHPEIVEPIAQRIDELYQESAPPLPNSSSGPSRPSSPESSTASPNRATRRAARRSTSKS